MSSITQTLVAFILKQKDEILAGCVGKVEAAALLSLLLKRLSAEGYYELLREFSERSYSQELGIRDIGETQRTLKQTINALLREECVPQELEEMKNLLDDEMDSQMLEIVEFYLDFQRKAKERLEIALRDTGAKYERLTTTLRDVIFEVGLDGRILVVRGAFEVMLGYKSEELIGEPTKFLFVTEGDFNQFWEEAIPVMEELGRYIGEISLRRKDGSTFTAEISCILLRDKDDEPTSMMGILRDITERKQLQEQLESALSEMEELLYVTSHDLNSPLITIEGFAGNLERRYADKLDDRGKRYIKRIRESVATISELSDSLLSLSRIGTRQYLMERVNTTEVVNRAIADLEGQIPARTHINVQANMPFVYCDELAIYQVFLNLISNAVKYMGTQAFPTVFVSWKEEAAYCEFHVKDNGIGIAQEHLQKIFRPFRRLYDIEVDGIGIGLSAVKKIIEKHGGRIRVQSKVGEGSTFYFTLPTKAGGR